MHNTKSQTSTEYLIITAVVIIIAVIVIGVLGGIPGIGGGIDGRVSTATLSTQTVGVTSFSISDYDTTLSVRNNAQDTITIDSITLNGQECVFFIEETHRLRSGETTQIDCQNVYELDDTSVSWQIAIDYTDQKTGGAFTQSDSAVVLESAVATEYLSQLDNHPSYYFENKGCYNTSLDPIPICTCYDLNLTRTNLDENHTLQNSIDFLRCQEIFGDAGWNSGSGWTPLGLFAETFDGGSYTISNLFVNAGVAHAGFFGTGSSGVFRNIGLVNVNITGSGGSAAGLVGNGASAQVINSFVSGGTITGTLNTAGLIGAGPASTISNSFASVNVVGSSIVGGLVGDCWPCTISASHATGNVTGSGGTIGGLAAYADGGTITNSYATGDVSGTSDVGGLIGLGASTTLSNNYATGSVTCTGSNCGGLVGWSNSGAFTSFTGNSWLNNSGDNASQCVGDYVAADTGGECTLR